MWVARVELIDHHTGRLVNAHSHFKLREEPMLLMEFHGSPTGVKEQAELVQELAIGLPYFLVGQVARETFTLATWSIRPVRRSEPLPRG